MIDIMTATSGSYWELWWFLGRRSDLSSGLQQELYLRRCWRGLLYLTIWVGIQNKANIWNSDNRPIFKLLYNCREVNFASWLWSIHTRTSFCHHDLTLLLSALVLEMNLKPVLKTKDAVTLILYSSICLAVTQLAPARRPCKSPMDSLASGAWKGSGGRCQWERGEQRQCRRKRRTRRSSNRSRLCPRSRSCAWLIDASPPVRWRNRGLGRREVCEHELATFPCSHHRMWP